MAEYNKTSTKTPTKTPAKTPTRSIKDMNETELSRLVDERISKALGLSPKDLEELPGEQGLMATPSVLSTVRATATAMC